MYGRISDPEMGTSCPRVALALFSSPSQSAIGRRGWGFDIVRGGFDPENHRFRPRVFELYMYGGTSEPGY